MQIEKVLSRSATAADISMWATLHVSRPDVKAIGWLVDSWGAHLRPRMNWVSREEDKFYRVYVTIDTRRNSISIREEDTDIEPRRSAFIRATLATWEEEWIEHQRLTARSS